jgi:hypothetical protein
MDSKLWIQGTENAARRNVKTPFLGIGDRRLIELRCTSRHGMTVIRSRESKRLRASGVEILGQAGQKRPRASN